MTLQRVSTATTTVVCGRASSSRSNSLPTNNWKAKYTCGKFELTTDRVEFLPKNQVYQGNRVNIVYHQRDDFLL